MGSGRSIGVIIPCFNQGRYARAAVESVLAQSERCSVVLVDDASTDGVSPSLCKALAGHRVKVVTLSRNVGRALVRNVALSELDSVEFVLNMDCDDVLGHDYVVMLADALASDESLGLVYGTLHYFSDEAQGCVDGRTWPTCDADMRRRYLENVVPGPGVMFRRRALDQTNGWRADFTKYSGEDYDIWLQIVGRGWGVAWVRGAQYMYRQHPKSFLANAGLHTETEIALSILRHHTTGIRTSVGMPAFMRRWLVPKFLSSIRRGDLHFAARIGGKSCRAAPFTFARCVTGHYLRRLGVVAHGVVLGGKHRGG